MLPEAVRQQVFIVAPAHNEARCIERVLRELVAVYPNVVVVDDGSSDETFAVARRVAPFVLRHVVNRGQGAALQTGVEFALRRGAQVVVTFDTDGQHCVEDVEALVAPIVAEECDITLGSRFLAGAVRPPLGRRVLLRLAVLFTRLVSGLNITDTHNGLRAFSRRSALQMDLTMDRMAHASEIIDFVRSTRLPYREIPVRIRYTEYSLAKGQSARDAVRVALQYLLGKTAR